MAGETPNSPASAGDGTSGASFGSAAGGTRTGRTLAGIGFEALVIAVAGLALALAANAVSPRGLGLARDYFPTLVPTTKSPPAVPDSNATLAATSTSPPAADDATRKLRERGLQTISRSEVIELFQDPRYQQGLVVFIDARDDQHYTAGHIPGAWQFHHYRAENYLPTVLPACLAAVKVVVYCGGGECEDSAFAAILLGNAGVPRETLYVYPGGINEWTAHGHPIETGPRGSGAP